MSNQPHSRLSVEERQRKLIAAIRSYGVFLESAVPDQARADYLMTHFLMGWCEAWHRRNWALMQHYLHDAERVLFDRLFGTGQNSDKIPAEPASEVPPENIGE